MKKSTYCEPSKAEMMDWIKEFTKWPHRMTGTAEGAESAEYVKNMFSSLGLKNVRIESAPSMCCEIKQFHLDVEGKEIDAFLSNGTNRCGESGLFSSDIKDAEIIYLGDGNPEDFEGADVKGKLVLCDVHFSPHSWKDMPGTIAYDPDGEFDRKRNIYNVYIPENYAQSYVTAMERGAAGYIGSLQEFMDQYYYNEDYTYIIDIDGFMEIPAVWVSRRQGQELAESIKEKQIKGSLKVETLYENREALNVIGMIPGMSDDITVIHSHHDATVRGAVQDASGMSVVFALAKYFLSLPKDEIKTTLMFLSTDSHYTDYEGHDKFLDRRESEGDKIVMDFCIEHIAKEMDLGENNEMIIYDKPETRILYATDTKNLPQIALNAFKARGLGHTLLHIAAPKGTEDFDPEYVCSDAYCFHERGIPVISHLTAPMYLSHNTDTFDKVYFDGLVPMVETYIDMITKVWDIMGY